MLTNEYGRMQHFTWMDGRVDSEKEEVQCEVVVKMQNVAVRIWSTRWINGYWQLREFFDASGKIQSLHTQFA